MGIAVSNVSKKIIQAFPKQEILTNPTQTLLGRFRGLATDFFIPEVKINLTRELKSTFYKPDKLKKLLKKYPTLERRVGTLPPELAKKLSNNEGIIQFDEALSSFSQKFTAQNGKIEECEITTLSQKLSEILGERVTISPVGGGKIGYGYKISTQSKDLFFKCFYDSSHKPLREKAGHGNYGEIATALYAQKNSPQNFIKFYMGRLGEKNDGYMLTEFIEGKASCKQRKFSFRDLIHKLITNDPNPANKIKGKIIDFGMCDLTEYDKMKPEAYKLLKRIMVALDEGATKNLEKIVKDSERNPEYKEVLAHVKDIISKKFLYNTEEFSSRKELFELLGLDYKPNLETIIKQLGSSFSIPDNIQKIAKLYGVSVKEIETMRLPYIKAKYSFGNNFGNNILNNQI